MKTQGEQMRAYFDGFFTALDDGTKELELQIGLRMIEQFGIYADAVASSNHYTYHHVYEWGMTGYREGRLFDLTAVHIGKGILISYHFLQSTVPNENGVVFADKASVMEQGNMVTFTTEKIVPIYGGEMFRTGTFTFLPGGEAVGGAFANLFTDYFTTKGAIDVSKVQPKLNLRNMTATQGKSDAKKWMNQL